MDTTESNERRILIYTSRGKTRYSAAVVHAGAHHAAFGGRHDADFWRSSTGTLYRVFGGDLAIRMRNGNWRTLGEYGGSLGL